MKHVLSFLRPYTLHMIIAFSLTMIELLVELLLPFFLGKMINVGVVHKDINNILMWGSIMIGMALFAFIAGIINSFYASHTSYGFSYDIRKKLFEKVQSFPIAKLNKFPTSGLVTRFTNDVRQVQNTIFMVLRIMSKAPLLVIGGVIMAFIVNVKLASIFIITVPLLIVFLLWVFKKASGYFDNLQHKVDNVNMVMQENLAGMRLIKAFFRRNHEEKRFVKANRQLADVTSYTIRFVESSMPVLLFIMNISLLFILWFGHKQSIAGTTAVGDVVAIVNYAMRVAMSISMFTFIIMGFSRAKASAERIDHVLSEPVNSLDPAHADEALHVQNGKIRFQRVTFAYSKSNKHVLHDLSFTIESKERIAIIGATGAGKTSLFQLIPHLYDPIKGIIEIDDKQITDYKLKHLRNAIGYVPQSPLLFTGSVADNIAWGKDHASEEEIVQAAKDAQIHETILELPNQYQTRIGQKGVNLSGGQKQRISIARALIRKPKILMLDDSTSALDLATESKLLKAIEKYQCTTLIITQKVSTALRSDRIFLLHEGELSASGTHEQLLEKSTLYQEIAASQLGKEHLHAE